MNRNENINKIKELIYQCNFSNATVSIHSLSALRVLLDGIGNVVVIVQIDGLDMLFRALKTNRKPIVDLSLSCLGRITSFPKHHWLPYNVASDLDGYLQRV
jgi:hypothetical protein